jgi:hypothetical protein
MLASGMEQTDPIVLLFKLVVLLALLLPILCTLPLQMTGRYLGKSDAASAT